MYTLNYNSITVLLHQGLKDLSIIFSSIQLLTILGHQYDSDLTELHDHDVIFNNWLVWFMCEDQKLSKLWNKFLCHLIHVCQGRIKYINNYCTKNEIKDLSRRALNLSKANVFYRQAMVSHKSRANIQRIREEKFNMEQPHSGHNFSRLQ